MTISKIHMDKGMAK